MFMGFSVLRFDAIKNALERSAFSILRYQIQTLIFRRIRIDPFDDLGNFLRS